MAQRTLTSEYDRSGPLTASPSARSLLLTVLGTLVYPHGGVAWTGSLLDALASFEIIEGNGRQAINRAGQKGWVTSERLGRKARWHLTNRAQTLLGTGADRIYAFGQQTADWDRRWLLLFASVPERERRLRYQLRERLNWAGFGSLAPGVWISPWPDRDAEAHEVLRNLDPDSKLETRSFVARHGEVGNEASIVDTAWNLAALADNYRRFITDYTSLNPTTPFECTRSLLDLVHAWRRFPAIDPGLPAELLPSDWPGCQAAELFAVKRNSWLEIASNWWESRELTHSH